MLPCYTMQQQIENIIQNKLCSKDAKAGAQYAV